MPLLHQGIRRCLLNRRGGGYTPITSPLQIPNVEAWWSSAEAAVEGYVDGAAITTLVDYSGNSNSWTQATPTKRGVWKAAVYNGQGALRMDATDDGYAGTLDLGAQPSNSTVAVLYAARRVGATNPGLIIQSDGAAAASWGVGTTDPGTTLVLGGTANISCYLGRKVDDVGKLVGIVATHTSDPEIRCWANLEPSNLVTTSNATPENVGVGSVGGIGATPADADILEIIIWNRKLTDDEIRDLYIYWNIVYGLDLELFSDTFEDATIGNPVNGFASEGSNISILGGTHSWKPTPWVGKENYSVAKADYPTSNGVDLNGLSVWGESMVARGTTKDTYLRVFGGAENDYRYRVAGARFAIPIPWGTDWDYIRFGFMISARDIAGAPAPMANNHFWYGLCSGNTNIPGDATIDHFLGVKTRNIGSWYYTAGQYYRYERVGAISVDGSTTEFGSVGSGYIAMPADTARFAMILTIVKGAPNFTVWNEIPITAAGNYAIPKTLFAQDVETIAHRNYTNSTRLTDEADRAVAVDEATNGYFDNVCLYWQGTGFEIELSALYLQRVTNPNV